jgi:hypothetical protein
MDTQQLEKRFQIGNHFMYIVLGPSITLVIVSFGCFINPVAWPSFANYTSGLWLVLQLIATSLGFYLLWSPRWKPLPFQNRINTIFGYFIAGWPNLIAFGLMTQKKSPTALSFLFFAWLYSCLLYILDSGRNPGSYETKYFHRLII